MVGWPEEDDLKLANRVRPNGALYNLILHYVPAQTCNQSPKLHSTCPDAPVHVRHRKSYRQHMCGRQECKSVLMHKLSVCLKPNCLTAQRAAPGALVVLEGVSDQSVKLLPGWRGAHHVGRVHKDVGMEVDERGCSPVAQLHHLDWRPHGARAPACTVYYICSLDWVEAKKARVRV